MINLVKNELYKIFRKKSTYFFLIFVVAFYSLLCVIGNKEIQVIQDNDYTAQIEMIESDINELKKNNVLTDNQKTEYVDNLARLDMYKFVKERNYDNLGAEFNYVKSTLLNYYITKHTVEVYKYDYMDVGYASEEDFNNKYNEALKKLDDFKPLEEVKNDLNNLNKEKVCEMVSSAYCDEYFNVYKKVLQYRIDNNVPYTEYNNSSTLSSYIELYPSYLEGKKNYDKYNKEQKEQYDSTVKSIKLTEYKMDHKLIYGSRDDSTIFYDYLYLPVGDLYFVIIFGLLIISCSIISDEFDKGTIKQLLIKPYSRNKIVTAKIIACIITALFFIAFSEIVDICAGFIYIKGFNLTDTLIQYDASIGKVIELNGFQLFGHYLLARIPYFLLFMLMIIFISTLSRNTALSAASGFLILILPTFLSLYIDKFKALAYLPFYTWDLSDFLFGGKSMYGVLDFKTCLIMDIIYIIVFFILTLVSFNHSEVKNQ